MKRPKPSVFPADADKIARASSRGLSVLNVVTCCGFSLILGIAELFRRAGMPIPYAVVFCSGVAIGIALGAQAAKIFINSKNKPSS